MASTLIIRLEHSSDQEASWLVTGPEGQLLEKEQHGPLSALPPKAEERKVILLLPGQQTVMTTAAIPVKGISKQLQIAPFALEDVLAEDISQMHFAVGPRRSDGNVPVAAVSLDTFEKTLKSLEEYGIKPNAVFSELQGCPDIPGAISVIVETDQAMLRLPSGEFIAIARDMLDTVLASSLQAEKPKKSTDKPDATVSVMFYLDAQVARDQAWIQSAKVNYPEAEFRQMADGTLPQLAAGIQGKNVINFLQGAYAPKSDWQRALKPWRVPALLAASLLITVTLLQAISLWRLSSVESDLDAALAVSLRQVFPGNEKISDPRRQLDQLRQSLRGGPGGSSSQFLDTVIALGGILPKLQDTRVEAASYRNQVLELRIKVPDVTTLDRLEREMEESGHFQINIQSANPRDDGVEGRIAIARSGS